MKKIWTLLKKDLWTFSTDKVLCTMVLIPPFLAVVFRIVIDDPMLVLLTCGLFNLVLSSTYLYPLLIAEEKGHGTIPLLVRSGVNERSFIVSKTAASFIQGMAAALVLFLISGAAPSVLPGYLAFNLFIMFCLLPYGLITALFAKEVNDVHVMATPGMCLFFIPPVFSAWALIFDTAAQFLPTGTAEFFLPMLSYEYGYRNVSPAQTLIVCPVWFAAGVIILYTIHRKRKFFIFSPDR